MTTKQQWIESCADRYMQAGGAPLETALHFAEACADQQAEINGETVAAWDSPSDAADEDMSYWSDDE
jgi:hypothetical protein